MANFRKQPPKEFFALRTLVTFKPYKFAAILARQPAHIQGMVIELLDAYKKLPTQNHKKFDYLQALTSSSSKPEDFAATAILQPELIQRKFKDLIVDYDELAGKETSLSEHSFEEQVENEHHRDDFQEHFKHNREGLQVAEEYENQADDYQGSGEIDEAVLQMVEEDDGTFTASHVTAAASNWNPKIRHRLITSLPGLRDVTMTLAEILSIRPDVDKKIRDRLASTRFKGRVSTSEAERAALTNLRACQAKECARMGSNTN